MNSHYEIDLEKKSDAAHVYEIVRPGQRLRAQLHDGRTLHVKGVPWRDDVLALVIAMIFGAGVALILSTLLRALT